jgi:WD40 repeat protein
MSDFPYPGLRPFQRHETDIFFGRETHTDQLIEKLGHAHFIAVVGSSGCGKSSLVRTGLIAGLETGLLAHAGVRWRIAECRPGNKPFAHLTEALLNDKVLGTTYKISFSSNNDAFAFLHAQLRRGPLSLYEILKENPLPEKTNLLILVDQFEELFRYYQPETAPETVDDAAAFVTLLLASSQNPPTYLHHQLSQDANIYIVITMRSDFLGDCALFYGLPEAINQGLFLTPRLTREQLQEAIEGPANVFDGEVEASLVNRLLNDVGNDPDQLPLLQHALMRMWNLAVAQNPQAILLTLQHYQTIGGLTQSLSQHADEAYQELTPAQQKIAHILFCNLTERGEGNRPVRRPVPLQEVVLQAGVTESQLIEIINVFRKAGRSFLTPAAERPLHAESVLDISHESLIRQWRRLKKWLHQEAESAELYQRLEDSARRWEGKRAELWSGIELEIALNWQQQQQPNAIWAKRYGKDKGHHFDLAMRFLAASADKQAEKQKEAELAHQRELEQVRQQTALEQKAILERRRAHTAIVGLIAAVFLASWGLVERNKALYAEQEAKFAKQEAIVAQQEAELAETEQTRSLFELELTHAALLARNEDYAAARAVLKETYEWEDKVATPRRHLRNLVDWFCELMGEAPSQIFQGADAQLFVVAISSDGNTLASAGENGTIVLFDAHTGQLIKRLSGHNEAIFGAVFHPHQPWLFTAGGDQQIIRWSLDGEKLAQWQTDYKIKSLAISADGQRLVGGGEQSNITFWQAATGEKLNTFIVDSIPTIINGLAFSPNGKQLAVALNNHLALLWDINTAKKIHTFTGHTDKIWGITFNAAGTLIATSSEDKSIRLWQVNTGKTQRILRGHKNAVFESQFINKGRYLVSTSQDHTLRIWDTDSGITLRVLQGHTAGVTDIAVFQEQIFASSYDGTVMQWEGYLPTQKIIELSTEPASVAIAPNGNNLAVGFADGRLQWYSLPEVQLLWEQGNAHTLDIQRLNFSHDGSLLASASFDNNAKLWQVTNNQLIKLKTFSGHKSAIYDVNISPNNQTVATASYDGHLGLFAIDETKQSFHSAHKSKVYSVEFNHTGQRLLTSGDDRYTRLWEIQDTPQIIQTFPQAKDEVMWATFSPNQQQVASAGRDWLVNIYSIKDNLLSHSLIGHEQTIHRAIFTPDGHQIISVSGDATVRLWDLHNEAELFTLHLPTTLEDSTPPLWDFDFRCTNTSNDCWIAVPLTQGKLVLYHLVGIYD